MSAPIPSSLSVAPQASQSGNPLAEFIRGDGVEGTPEVVLLSFKEILADETMLTKFLDDLKDVLPTEELAKLEDLAESGNDLPLAAIIPPDSPLYSLLFNGETPVIPQVIQQAVEQDGSQLSPLVASGIKLSAGWSKQGGDANKRQINDLLTPVAARGDEKHLTDQLVAARSELTVTDLVPKTLATSALVSDATTTQTASINSAISGLAQLSNFQTSGGSSTPPAIAAPLGDDGWSQAMGDRIMWMIGKGVQTSSIRINPPNLGPIQVHVSVHNDQASVNILAQHGAVKDAIEAAIPRLREMMHEGNLQLVNVDVSHRENMQQEGNSALFQQEHRDNSNYFTQQEQTLSAPVEEESPRYYTSSGLLDDYA